MLSGGQRQRVALARALVSHPRLLLLDEPLGALDALTRIEMQRLIERVWRDQGFTALLVTHDVAEAVALADRVMLIEDGRIALDVAVDLARPRRRGSAELAALEGAILSHLCPRDASSLTTREPRFGDHAMTVVPHDLMTETAVSSADFRGAMRHLTGGVSVITAGRGKDITGLTVTSVSSLSVEPPTLMVGINRVPRPSR